MTPPRDSRILGQSIALVVVFLLSLLGPMVGPVNQPATELDEQPSVQFSSPFSANSGHGHDFGGMSIVYDGLDQAMVRQESLIDQFTLDLTMFNVSEHPGTPDVKLTRYAKQHWCWSTQEGSVRTWSTSANLNTSLVDTVTPTNASQLVDCAIAVTDNELQRVLYADGPDLKMGRYAMQSQTYWDGPRWHTRTIMENVNATDLELSIHPDGVEWGVMRTDDGMLYQVNFSGAYWSHAVLDEGPVGRDIVLRMDQNGIAHVLYTLENQGDVVLLRVDGSERDRRLLATDANTVDALGMDLDSNNIEQVATAKQSSQAFSIDLIRSLAGQDTGRVDPSPSALLTAGLVNLSEGHVMVADVNNDGMDDVLITTPTASANGLEENGRFDVHYGAENGIAASPNLTIVGTVAFAHLGAGLAVGDLNNDDVMDVVLGVPGHRQDNDSLDQGRVQVHHGSSAGLSSGPNALVGGTDGEQIGSVVVVLERHNGNVLAASANNFSQVVDSTTTHFGKVNLYAVNGSQLDSMRNLTQSGAGDMFGRTLSPCDVNGDGMDDLIIGNTGTFSNALTYSSVEYFTASATGYNGTPTHMVQSDQQNRLFGHNIACVGDINGDGLEEHIINEPFNGTSVFGGGKLWLYNGTAGPMTTVPDWTLQPAQANARVGESIIPAGDVNEDGFNDVYISSVGGSANGALRLYLGSSGGIQSESQLIAEGTSGQRVGAVAAAMADLNGDGLGELVYSIRAAPDNGEDNHELKFIVLSERDWEAISFDVDGTLGHMALATAGRGETSVVFSHHAGGQHHLSKLEHMNDGTPAGRWVTTGLALLPSALPGLAFDVTASGQPVMAAVDTTNNSNQFLVSTTERSYTALEQTLVSQGTLGQHLGSTLDNNEDHWLAYTSGAGQQVFFSEQTSSGWDTGMVRQSAAINGPIEVLSSASGIPHLVYNHGNQQLELAVKDGTWALTSLGAEGEALSVDHPTKLLANGTVAIALAAHNTSHSGADLELWMHNGSNLTQTEVMNNIQFTDMSIGLTQASNGSMMICTIDSTGALHLHVQNGTSGWYHHHLADLSGPAGKHHLICDSTAVLAANPQQAVFLSLHETNWTSMPAPPGAHADGPFDMFEHHDHWTMVSSDPQSQELRLHSLTSTGSEYEALWTTAPMTGLTPTGNLNPLVDANGTVHMAYWDALEDDVELLRLYVDTDRDLVFDLIDGMPHAGDQWNSADGDNYGDNPDGPLADACPTESGPSSYHLMGCPDFDTDGWADSLDGCSDEGGTSWIDRYGCTDYDQDGWSDNLGSYIGGDRYYSNWKQALDTDGDGFGDNHGVDCCAVPLDPNANSGDLFPYLASQYADYDGDGFGDNYSDNINGDFCPYEYGTSFRDVNGCLDTDGDGAGDPYGEDGDFDARNASTGADLWPLDGTQWADTDGDGYGDNNSLNATNPDQFPFLEAVATDNDLDGFPDEWTQLYNGTNNNGLVLDGCLDEWGNSTSPVPGCLDSDGDGFRDVYTYSIDDDTGLRINQQGDAFRDDPTQWSDEDGDGFGDQLDGLNGDRCPQDVGVLNGTAPNGASSGVGCRLVDVSDADGDGVINDVDACPETSPGASVNSNGCAASQLDDDDDGVNNDVDLCPNSQAAAVDNDGCTTEQRTTDTDNDGVNDPLDTCPGTSAGAETDASGCADDQRDSDGDGLVDAQDACANTPAELIQFIDATGCVDEAALDVDRDGDGYAGRYTYTLDNETGLHTNQSGDAFPSEASQWWDTDGDGFGDNTSGVQGDDCPLENGTSFRDDLGCLDDGDGWRDSLEDAPLRNDSTQWRDTDYDGVGDNWGNPSWNQSRTSYFERLNANGGSYVEPGQFILGATNADLCPFTPDALRSNVDEDGCHPSERDSDNDGVMDLYDTCPQTPRGADGFADGCPKASSNGDNENSILSGTAGTAIVYGGAGLMALVLVGVMIRVLRNRGDDDDDDYDDDYDDDDDEPRGFGDQFNRTSTVTPAGRRSSTTPASSRTSPATGPSSKPPSKSFSRSGPPGNSPSRGPKGRSGPPTSTRTGGPPKAVSQPAPAQKVAKKKSVSSTDEPQTKVRKAKIRVDLSSFEDWQAEDRDAAVEWVVGAFSEGEEERTMLMQLQETGWSAEQSRAICDLAKNQ